MKKNLPNHAKTGTSSRRPQSAAASSKASLPWERESALSLS